MKRLMFLMLFAGLPGPAFADDPPDPPEAPAPPAPPAAPRALRPPSAPRAVRVHVVPPVPPVPPVPAVPPVPPVAVRPLPPLPPLLVARNHDDDDDEGEDDDDDDDDDNHADVHRHNGGDFDFDFDFNFDTDGFLKTFEDHLKDVPFVDKNEIKRIVKEAKENAREQMREARDRIREARDQAREQAHQARDQAREQVREQIERVREQMEEQRDRMREQHDRMREQHERMRSRMKECDDDDEGEDDDDDDDDEAVAPPAPPRPPRAPVAIPGPPAKDGTASLQVGGPVSFHLENAHGDVEISAASANQISVSGPGCAPGNVQFDRSGEEVEAELDVDGCRGPLRVSLPSGSRVKVSAMTGNITLRGGYGDVELEAVSGNISVDRAANAELSTVGGNLVLRDATGRVKAETVGGNASISMSGSAPRLDFESVSGNLTWSGLCGRGCRLATETFSGTAELKLDPRSSFSFRHTSRGGNVRDELGIKTDGRDGGNNVRGVFGGGEGVVTTETFRGNVRVTRR